MLQENLKYRIPDHIPIKICNVNCYDVHPLIKKLRMRMLLRPSWVIRRSGLALISRPKSSWCGQLINMVNNYVKI